MTIHWKDDLKPLKQICLVDVETDPDPKWITVICGNQTNILKAFALCWRALAPDIVIGFNDSDYNWPFIVEKASRLRILDWMWLQMSANSRQSTTEQILRWNYYGSIGKNPGSVENSSVIRENVCEDEEEDFSQRAVKIKISSEESFISSFLKFPGCVPIDIRASFKKLYPRSEVQKGSSLKFYLKMCDLGGKIDMPINRIWDHYEIAKQGYSTESAKHMHEVTEYCIIDALRCQQLLVKRNVINDNREVASIAYVSLFDAHYRANGMKVCNLLGAEAWKQNILISMIPCKDIESGKYPGAHVFPPIKGLNNKRPVTGLDFASLYPSIIMTYNFSPEKIVLEEKEAIDLQQKGIRLHKIEFPFNGRILQA
ncbi:hypothetical protein Glove_426g54 [Diversispora epigaea]|uniref:DNA polymerase delta catalytic subunit n=1 Tax=Diversispora epigaea TaxID=1348612 RepID=A0A397GY52_9GLOM|nr:hypothetical protein Glove_426g54 [Diversispora epigaea]